jgi:hypothetical protein
LLKYVKKSFVLVFILLLLPSEGQAGQSLGAFKQSNSISEIGYQREEKCVHIILLLCASEGYTGQLKDTPVNNKFDVRSSIIY